MASAEVWCRVTVCGPDGSALGSWTIRGSGAPGLDVVDLLARVHLQTSGRGGSVTLTDVAASLGELLDLAGLNLLRG